MGSGRGAGLSGAHCFGSTVSRRPVRAGAGGAVFEYFVDNLARRMSRSAPSWLSSQLSVKVFSAFQPQEVEARFV